MAATLAPSRTGRAGAPGPHRLRAPAAGGHARHPGAGGVRRERVERFSWRGGARGGRDLEQHGRLRNDEQMKEPAREPSRELSPVARRERLLVREGEDELVVYDLESHRAHSLSRAAALIWRHCDGRTTVAELAALLHRELDAAPDETVVWMALRRLGKAHLLRDPVTVPSQAVSCSRRELTRRMAVLGGLAFVSSILVPEPVQAQSACRPDGAACISSTQCCSGCCRLIGSGLECRPGAGGCV